MKKLLLATLCGLSLVTQLAHATHRFDKVVSLGDSLSDNGNLYKYSFHLLPKSPPYYKGRFTNGPTWVEQLSDKLFRTPSKHLINYSVGGAGAVLTMKENLPFTLKTEISNYLYLHHFNNKKDSLYTIWIGANNYTNVPSNAEVVTSKVVNAIVTNVKNLIAHDAKMVLLMNLPDLGHTPEAKEKKAEAKLTQLSTLHNEKLYRAYLALKDAHPEVTFLHYNIFAKFNEIMDNPQTYAVTNTTDACYLGGYRLKDLPQLKSSDLILRQWLTTGRGSDHQPMSAKMIDATLANPMLRESVKVDYQSQRLKQLTGLDTAALDCRGYLFWDHIHPSVNTHQILANDIEQFLIDNDFKAK